ncbi:MAG: hypothetical protein LBO09_07310 [Candidatus Peribacteria bacterium]|jgi:hypothetical protein|nr:hypothetical protein [Candidatus Peribacteria bacterium]
MAGAIALITLLFTGANYYTITRRIAIFGGQINSKLIILFISLLITLIVVGLQTATFANTKFFSILGSIGSRMFMLIPIVAILMGIEHLISTFLFFTPLSGGEGGGRTETKWK